MKSKNFSKIIKALNSKGFKNIELDPVIETKYIRGVNLKKYLFTFNDDKGVSFSLRPDLSLMSLIQFSKTKKYNKQKITYSGESYRKNKNMVNHKFPVYSKIGENGALIPKLVKCNNCDALHYVNKVGQSEIRGGKDQTEVVIKKEDIALMIPPALNNVLSNYDCDISSWEHAHDIMTEQRWGEIVVLKRDIIDENQQVKIVGLNLH